MKTVVILSGGMDSTVLLHYQHKACEQVKAISMDYGQRHRRELDCARFQTQQLGVEHKVIDLSSLRQIMGGSALTDDVAVPHGHYAEENMKQTVVPNRNMILISVAAAYAISEKADTVSYGAHAGDHTIYPDCREEFAAALNQAVMLADWHQVKLDRPFIHKSKIELVKIGMELGVNFAQTHTCYEGSEIACGKCGTCVERLEAFAHADHIDPLKYQDRDYWKTVSKL